MSVKRPDIPELPSRLLLEEAISEAMFGICIPIVTVYLKNAREGSQHYFGRKPSKRLKT